MRKLQVIIFSIALFVLTLISTIGFCQTKNGKSWKAGVSSVVITPDEPMWMAGYASRTRPSEGTLTDLWAKALAFEDGEGKRSVLVTMDLVGIPKIISDRIRDRLETKYLLKRDQIILNSSHTHSGPVLSDFLLHLFPIDSIQIQKIDRYTIQFEEKIDAIVGKALQSLKPVKLFSGNGVTRFQVNRRNNHEATLNPQTELNGPNDYSVPVIQVVDDSGHIMAIAFGYACHNTVLSGYQWSGDYAGYAQIEVEKMYPGTTALFFQGCGGNQNPLPRRTVPLAKQYGKELAAAVEGLLNEDMEELSPYLKTSYAEVNLALNKLPPKEELMKFERESSGHYKAWANLMLGKLERNEPIRTSYPYPIQVWQLGDQTMMALGGEAVIEYALKLKQIFGQDIFVLGYSNDVMSYIPTVKVIKEGGYEGATSQLAFGLPATYSFSIESTIIGAIIDLAKTIDVAPIETNVMYD